MKCLRQIRFGAPFTLVCLSVLSLMALLAGVSPAAAATVTTRSPIKPPFDGSDTTAGKFTFQFNDLEGVAVDESTGMVYVVDYPTNEPVLDKFNADGQAQNFQSTGQSSLSIARPEIPGSGVNNSVYGIAVDNSDVNAGLIYVAYSRTVRAITPTGEFLPWELELPSTVCNLAVDAEGHLWVSDRQQPIVREYAGTGGPPAQIGELQDVSGTETPCQLALNHGGDLFIGQIGHETGSVDKYVGGAFDSVLDPYDPQGIAVDQTEAAGHIFIAHAGNFSEYDSTGNFITNYGEGINGEISIGAGNSHLAYNAVLDRVYVQKGFPDRKVFIFGPPEALGLAPDLTISPTTSDSIHTAHVSGTINPLGLENSYHFEYKANGAASWVSGVTSTVDEHIVPTDSDPHDVAADLAGLESFTQYQVRLVATNDETGTKVISKVDRFRTGKPAVVTIDDPSAVSAHSVHVDGIVNPGDTEATWRFQTSSSSKCLIGEGFSDHSSQTIDANAGPTPVSDELTGLSPNQKYCVRLAATNGPGTTTSEIKQFQTDAVVPVIELRGAAPRTETGARLNAFLETENAATTYHFEYSENGGDSWIALPDHLLAAGASAVLVSEQLTGLLPATSYSFRLAAESVGGAPPQVESQSFKTLEPPPASCPNEEVRQQQRTDGYLGACRGIELVSNPDKGNQTAFATGPGRGAIPAMTPDGSKVLWFVLGGAPGAPNGTQANFLATRSEAGWNSVNIAPAAEEQAGKGDLAYLLSAATPDFGTFVFGARGSTGLASPQAPTIVRMQHGKQDILRSYAGQVPNAGYENSVDLSEDGEHVLFMNLQTKQLEDIGAARVGPPEVSGEVVSLMSDGSPSECGLDLAGGRSFPGLQGGNLVGHPGDHWIAANDASRVYFAVQADGVCAGPYGLYVRNREAGKTIPIDLGTPGRSPELIRVSPNGHRAYYVTFESLDPAVDTVAGSADVYRWDEDDAGGKSSCVTCVVGGSAHLAEINGDLASVLISKDFSHIYFYSRERLVPGRGEQGELNLYVLSGGQIRFVAVTDHDVLGRDAPELSADGKVLLFGAQATPELTSDAMAAQCVGTNGGLGNCQERYLYNDLDHSIECVSCRHGGITTHSAGSPGGGDSFELSGDGTTLAFATPETLVPKDVNGDTDIYEWREGAVRLVSDGVSDFQEGLSAPRVWTVDEDGSDILFGLVPPGGSLTGFERDSVSNLYDARIGGGWAPPGQEEECEGDSCQGPLQAAPSPSRPASSALTRGNLNTRPLKPKCRKGKVRRRGHCVARHIHKSKRHKRFTNTKSGRAR